MVIWFVLGFYGIFFPLEMIALWSTSTPHECNPYSALKRQQRHITYNRMEGQEMNQIQFSLKRTTELLMTCVVNTDPPPALAWPLYCWIMIHFKPFHQVKDGHEEIKRENEIIQQLVLTIFFFSMCYIPYRI